MAKGRGWLAIALLALLGSLLVAFSAYAGSVLPVSGMLVGVHHADASQGRISEKQIYVSESAVTIRVPDASLGRFEDSGSMGPLVGQKTNAILIKPDLESDIKAGDVIAYSSDEAGGLVSHRVVRTGLDENGWFAIAKGDNARYNDPEKVRFSQIKYVVVGILY